MSRILISSTRTLSYTLTLLAVSGLAMAQDPRGWRHVGDPAPSNQPANSTAPGLQDQDRGAPQDNGAPPNYEQNAPPPNAQYSQYQGDGGAPSHLTIRPGTFVTVRINQALSSDRNQAGDAFAASLARPLVVDGVVVAQTGQMVGGRVTEAQKAGRVTGTSRLRVQLTDLTLVDGQQLPIQSQMIQRNGPTSVGRDAGAIAGTTALGAAVGAAADWGRGAAIGAGAGAAAGVLGVLLTRGAPTIVYPESVLTFRIEAPVTVSTDRAPQAFRYVEPGDYDRANQQQASQGPPPRMGMPGPPPPYASPYYGPYPYYGYPGVWGGSFGVFWGPRFYSGGFVLRGGRRW
jgi:hypothetical protein